MWKRRPNKKPQKGEGNGWFIAAGAVFVLGCLAVYLKPTGATTKTTTDECLNCVNTKPTNTGPNLTFGIPSDFSAAYEVVKKEDTPLGTARRRILSIVLPPGLTRAQLNLNLKHAAKSEYDRGGIAAVRVLAYLKGGPTDGKVTTGKCDLAPFGDWERAEETVPRTQVVTHVTIEEKYFNGPLYTVAANVISIPQEVRKQIYRELMQANQKAARDAQIAFPPSATESEDLKREATQVAANMAESNRNEVRDHHRLTNEQVSSILQEGSTLHWPSEPPVKTVSHH
jgi:hypothetical protein